MLLALFSCVDDKSKTTIEKKYNTTGAEQQPETSREIIQGNFYIEDKALYSQTFIKELLDSNYPDSIKVIGNQVIVKTDTIYFPNDLVENEVYVFSATKDNKQLNLTVKRINATTIDFDFKLIQHAKLVYKDSGQAVLGPLFFLASEVDEDNESGTAYGAVEYIKKDKKCWFIIRIGMGKDELGRNRATVSKICDNRTIEIGKEKLTLHTKPI